MVYFFFYFPLGLDAGAARRARMTWCLAAAAIVVFLICRLRPEWFWTHATQLVYVPAAPTLVALVASAFVHGDWLHLGSNVLALVVFGPALEARLGAWRLAALFLVCHVLGNLVQGAMALELAPQTAAYGVVGASGALAGWVGVALVRLHFARLRVAYWAFLPLQAYTRAGTQTLPVGVAALLWFLMQVGLAVAHAQGGDTGIAVGAHLGGLLAGVALALVFGLRRAAAAEAHLHRGRAYLAAASWYPAQGEFLDYVRCRPQDADGHLELARTFRLTGGRVAADEHYRRAGSLLAARRAFDRVEAVHDEASRGNAEFVLEPAAQLQLGRLLERACKCVAAERVFDLYARAYADAPEAAWALYRAARLRQARRDDDGARSVYQRLLADYPSAAEADLARMALAAGSRPTTTRRAAA